MLYHSLMTSSDSVAPEGARLGEKGGPHAESERHSHYCILCIFFEGVAAPPPPCHLVPTSLIAFLSTIPSTQHKWQSHLFLTLPFNLDNFIYIYPWQNFPWDLQCNTLFILRFAILLFERTCWLFEVCAMTATNSIPRRRLNVYPTVLNSCMT